MDRPDEIVASLKDQPVVVVGDLILDRYITGEAPRISPEAPVPVIHVQNEEHSVGGAANVAANLASLQARPLLIGVLGHDQAGQKLSECVEKSGVGLDGVHTCASRPTIEKTRLVARHQQVVRFDREEIGSYPAELERELCRMIARQRGKCKAVILSDYGKGVVSPAVVQAVLDLDAEVYVDPKGQDYRRYLGAHGITPNAQEAEAATGISTQTLEGCRQAAENLFEVAKLQSVIITRGAQGIFFRQQNGEEGAIPTRARSVFDVTGAGDTVIAVLALARASGHSLAKAVQLANAAAGVVVERFGAARVAPAELAGALTGTASTATKVLSMEGAERWVRRNKSQGRVVVFTNGCFDLLHAGHVQSLEFARSQGDLLVVGVNEDDSVRRQKGPSRPIVPVDQRMRVLAALACVDVVVPFAADTPRQLVEALTPDVLVKGNDWQSAGVVGQDWVERHGGQVVLAPTLGDFSTSNIIETIQGAPGAPPGEEDDEVGEAAAP
jgi:D-beta-D-heptose 7-phosphate kinase/D-beta-D-heptose 1-phosphate adenosyltransferase